MVSLCVITRGGERVNLNTVFYLRRTDPSKNKAKGAFLNRDANEMSLNQPLFFC